MTTPSKPPATSEPPNGVAPVSNRCEHGLKTRATRYDRVPHPRYCEGGGRIPRRRSYSVNGGMLEMSSFVPHFPSAPGLHKMYESAFTGRSGVAGLIEGNS